MKCKNEILLAKVGKEKLTPETEVELTVLDPIDSCRRINTRDYVGTDATAGTLVYDQYSVPDDQFNCYGDKCANSGTLTIPSTKKVVYRIPYNALDTYLGVITFYALASAAVTVKISDTKEMTNADVYTPSVVSGSGYKAVVVDLTQEPSSTDGDGWTYVAGQPVFIEISSATENIGISTIALFESMEAFVTMNVVKFSCVSGLEGAWELALAEDTCVQDGDYNTNETNEFEFTLTGKKFTPNYNILNPMHNKGDKTVGWQSVNVVKTTKAGTAQKYNGKSYITLDDMNQDECGFLSVQIKDYCHTTDAQMIRLNIPVTENVTLDERHYIVIKNSDGTTDLVFGLNGGMDMLVSYPQLAQIEHFVGNYDFLEGRSVRVAWPETMTDGTKYMKVLTNAKITSFPWGISQEEQEAEITFQARRDANGNFYEMQRIISNIVPNIGA